MFIYDKTKSKIIEFRSDFNFDTDFVKKLVQASSNNNLNYEYCQKSDYWWYVPANEREFQKQRVNTKEQQVLP